MENTTDNTSSAPDTTERLPLGFWMRLVRVHLRAALHEEFEREAGDRAELRERLQARVRNALDPEEYDALVASLQKVARELGWDGSERMPRGRGHGFGPGHGFGRGAGRGFGRGAGRGFGPGFRGGFDPRFGGGFGPRGGDHDPHPFEGERGNAHRGFGPGESPRHGHHRHGDPTAHACGEGRHGRGHGGGRTHRGERAYERGFEAGVAAASRLSSAAPAAPAAPATDASTAAPATPATPTDPTV